MNNENIVISRVFNAPVSELWRAWTTPDVVQRWWGPEHFTCPSAKIDLKEGGRYVYAMKGPAGSEWDKVMYSGGIYKEIIPNERIVATDYFCDEQGNKISPTEDGQSADFPTEMNVIVTFQELEGNQTKLTLNYPATENEAQFEAIKNSGMEQGWQSSLNKLEKCL